MTGSAFNFVCVKIPLCNAARYDITDSTIKHCLRLNEFPNEFLSRQFSLLTVLIIGLIMKIIFISELRTLRYDYEQFII